MSTKKEIKFLNFNLKHVVLCGVVLIFAVYSVVTLISLYSQIGQKKSELESIKDEIAIQEIKNEEMQVSAYSEDLNPEFSGNVLEEYCEANPQVKKIVHYMLNGLKEI